MHDSERYHSIAAMIGTDYPRVGTGEPSQHRPAQGQQQLCFGGTTARAAVIAGRGSNCRGRNESSPKRP
jgi:hypothetical protein